MLLFSVHPEPEGRKVDKMLTLKKVKEMEWVRQMNACKAQAEEIVKAELIYD